MSDTLRHYGILGMRWGVRRNQVQLGRANGSTDDDGPSSKQTGGQAASNKPGRLSNEELRSRVTRLSLEKTYRDLESSLNPQKTSVVKKLLGEALQNLGRQALSVGVNKLLKSTIDKPVQQDKPKEYSLDEIDQMDVSKMTASMLSTAANMYGSAGKINVWREKVQAEVDKRMGKVDAWVT